MFTDEDADYVEFHNKCQDMFIRRFGKQKTINKKALIEKRELAFIRILLSNFSISGLLRNR